MTNLRTTDTEYGHDYWTSYGNGEGYNDSPLWEDLAFIITELFVPQGKVMMDFGCASGWLVKHLRRRGVETFGCDFSEYAISHADREVRDYLRPYDLTSDEAPSHLPGYPFDYVTCFETLEHIPEESAEHALEKIKRSLKNYGVALLTICTDARPDWDTDPTHICIKPESWWADLLERQGWTRLDAMEEKLKQFRDFRHLDGVFIVMRED